MLYNKLEFMGISAKCKMSELRCNYKYYPIGLVVGAGLRACPIVYMLFAVGHGDPTLQGFVFYMNHHDKL